LVLALIFCVVGAIVPRHRARQDSPRVLSQAQELSTQQFNAYKTKYNKVYETAAEEATRFENFKQSIHRSAQRNLKSPNAVFGITKFSDLSVEEFKQYLGYVPKPRIEERAVFSKGEVDAPGTYDWRDKNRVTPVKDQGQCGSCWAFSATENIESIYMIKNNIGGDSMDALSVQEIVDCDTQDKGCNGGDPPSAFAYVMSAGGLETESDYPYTATTGSCNFDQSRVKVSINNWKYATQSSDESEMVNALVNWGPLSICVDAEPWQDYSGGIMSASDCDTSLDHCVQAVGYDTSSSTPYWSVRNSWGSDWGENGYIRLQYGQDTCGCADEATSACIDC